MKKLGHIREFIELMSVEHKIITPLANLAVYPLRHEAFRQESFSSHIHQCRIHRHTLTTCIIIPVCHGPKQTGKKLRSRGPINRESCEFRKFFVSLTYDFFASSLFISLA